MMEQESKQVQQGQENSWKDLTAEEMAALMRYFMVNQDRNLYVQWGELKKDVINDYMEKGDDESERDPKRLIGFVGGLLTYFFTFIAAMNERASWNTFQGPNAVDDLAKRYNLDVFCFRENGNETYTFEDSIAQIIPYLALPEEYKGKSGKEKTKLQKTMCWKRILRYLDEENAPTLQDNVEKIFSWLRDKNDEASKVLDEKEMDSYEKCLDILNDWWAKNFSNWWAENGPVLLLRVRVETNPFTKEVKDRIKQGVKQIILTGAPGTGKTYAAKLIARGQGKKLKLRESEEPKEYALVQFHPSYDYTDFVEGLRPVEINGENRFVKLDGQFKAFCRRVVKEGDPAKKYFFLIDEINRADISKVFGELMFCLEADKRVRLESDEWSKDDFEEQKRENSVQTQYQNLPTYDIEKGYLKPEEDVFHGGFFIPDNVIVIGTMNDIDRSVESMDFALRRRFDWMEAVVDEKMLKTAFSCIFEGMGSDDRDELVKSVVKVNNVIEAEGRKYGLTRQHFISQGQFANLPKLSGGQTAEAVKKYVWKYRLEPLLREYLRGEDERSIDKFINGQEKQPDGSQEEAKKDCCKDAFGVKDEA